MHQSVNITYIVFFFVWILFLLALKFIVFSASIQIHTASLFANHVVVQGIHLHFFLAIFSFVWNEETVCFNKTNTEVVFRHEYYYYC